jgi:acetyl-CoA C-acetyltransferase
MGVVVMGAGFCGSFPASGGLSYRELIARAAAMAYEDAGIEAAQLDGAVSVEEDFISGYSISDEYTPDQLGVVRKPVYTICGDFLHGIASAVMQINTGRFRTVVVEGYSKASNVLCKDEVLHFAYDPVWDRLGVSPHYLAGIEMQHFIDSSNYGPADIAEVVVKNRGVAVSNPLAPYGARLQAGDVLGARPVASPVTELMMARPADAAVVIVLGDEETALKAAKNPVFIGGTGWGSGNSIIERRNHAMSIGTMTAGKMAYAEAGIANPSEQLDAFYISDLYAHRQLMHLEALGLSRDVLPLVNPDGGALGMGDMFEATGGARFYDAVRLLRGDAGEHQIAGAERVLVHGWRGLPTDSCAVVVLDAERRGA